MIAEGQLVETLFPAPLPRDVRPTRNIANVLNFLPYSDNHEAKEFLSGKISIFMHISNPLNNCILGQPSGLPSCTPTSSLHCLFASLL